jgi:hypothetical protein
MVYDGITLIQGTKLTNFPLNVAVSIEGEVEAEAKVLNFVAPYNLKIPQNFVGSYAKAASAGSAVFTVWDDSIQIGTITFSSSTTGVFQSSQEHQVEIGSLISIIAPEDVNSAPANIGITLSVLAF